MLNNSSLAHAITRENAAQLFKKLCKEYDGVLDLRDVEVMDSTGAMMLARLERRLERKGQTLRLAHADCAVGNVLRNAGLEHLLNS